MKIMSYKDLIVWQKAMDLVVGIYDITNHFPKSETYGLISQMRRAAVSIPSNIAGGSRRSSRKYFRNFLLIAYGSGSELETQIELSKRLSFGSALDYSGTDKLLDEVMRMLNKMISNLRTNN